MAQTGSLIEYQPGQYGILVRGNADSRSAETCATCGQPIGYAGYARRMGDEAPVHYMADRDRPGYVLDCVTENTFRDGMAG